MYLKAKMINNFEQRKNHYAKMAKNTYLFYFIGHLLI